MPGFFSQQSGDDGVLSRTGTQNQNLHALTLPALVASVWTMGARKIPEAVGQDALSSWVTGNHDSEVTQTAVRYSLQLLASVAPGSSVEVRVPPYGAVQVIQGPSHSRGTPSAVVETSPEVWLALVTGALSWEGASSSGAVQASGVRSDLSAWLPLVPLP